MKIKVDKKAVGLRIKQIRLNKGYTLEEFGKLYGASKGNVQQWENGGSLPNKDRIKQIAKFADLTVNELLYGSVEEFIRNNYTLVLDEVDINHDIFKKAVAKTSKITTVNELDTILTVFNEKILEEMGATSETRRVLKEHQIISLISETLGEKTAILFSMIIKLDKQDLDKIIYDIIKILEKNDFTENKILIEALKDYI